MNFHTIQFFSTSFGRNAYQLKVTGQKNKSQI
jgi:hypothetical protein